MKAEHTRRDFLAKSSLAGMAALTVPFTACAEKHNTNVQNDYPQSAYLQAGHLYNRYKKYFNIK